MIAYGNVHEVKESQKFCGTSKLSDIFSFHDLAVLASPSAQLLPRAFCRPPAKKLLLLHVHVLLWVREHGRSIPGLALPPPNGRIGMSLTPLCELGKAACC